MSALASRVSPAVSSLMHSGEFSGQTDDRLKDEDHVSWVMKLSDSSRNDWLTTLQWVRAADRLLETQLFGEGESRVAGAEGFGTFMSDWRALRSGGVPGSTRFRALFGRLTERWLREGVTEPMLEPWDHYLESLWRYRAPIIDTVAHYVDALYGLSGTFFQAFPLQPPGLSAEVGALGTLDQLFNNLRDLREDIVRGIYYFPTDLLDRFGIRREELPGLVDRVDVRMVRINEHILATVVPKLRHECARLLTAENLHESWREMLHSVCLRHNRIEYVARLCRFNPTDFLATYWPLVRDDLGHGDGASSSLAAVGPTRAKGRGVRPPAVADDLPYHRHGNYAPVKEEMTAFDLAVTGTIPEALHGRYLRNGPNPRVADTAHWFFGDGMIHAIELADGRATWYRNRSVRTNGFREGTSTMAADGSIDLANTHVLAHAGRVFALMETSGSTEITTRPLRRVVAGLAQRVCTRHSPPLDHRPAGRRGPGGGRRRPARRVPPRRRPSRRGPYRYSYTLGAGAFDESGPVGASRLFKHDPATGSTDVHDFGPGRMPGEGVFVAASAESGEDEGYLMTYVYDARRGKSDFVILDAHDFGDSPIATVHLPNRVPFRFHGSWVADE